MNDLSVLLSVLLVALLAGCGASVGEIHAGIARSALETQVELEPMIRGARRDAMTRAADEVHSSGGTREAAQAAVAEVSRLWECGISGHRLFASATSAYVGALWLEQVQGGPFSFESLGRFVRPVLDAYRATASCVTSLGLELPVPNFLNLLPPAWGLGGDHE